MTPVPHMVVCGSFVPSVLCHKKQFTFWLISPGGVSAAPFFNVDTPTKEPQPSNPWLQFPVNKIQLAAEHVTLSCRCSYVCEKPGAVCCPCYCTKCFGSYSNRWPWRCTTLYYSISASSQYWLNFKSLPKRFSSLPCLKSNNPPLNETYTLA